MEPTKPYKVDKMLVWQAYQDVKQKGGAAGIDEETIKDFEENLKDNLYKIWNRMSSGTYFPPAVKGVPIPKKSGGIRLLGIPAGSKMKCNTVDCLVERLTKNGVADGIIRTIKIRRKRENGAVLAIEDFDYADCQSIR